MTFYFFYFTIDMTHRSKVTSRDRYQGKMTNSYQFLHTEKQLPPELKGQYSD